MVIDGFTIFGSWPGQPEDHPVEQLIEGLERYKLQYACSLCADSIYLDADAGNDATCAACERDKRLIPIGTADPRVGSFNQVCACADRCFKLMALFPLSQGWSLESITAKTLLKEIDAAKLSLIVEAGKSGCPSQVLQAVGDLPMPVILLDVSLPVLAEAMAVLKARPNTYLTTRLLSGGDTIEYLCEEVGADRLIYASRYPVSCFSSAFLTAKFATISDADRNAIMGDTMAKLIGLA